MNYFAYGSNLSSTRLLKRCPSAEVVCTASISKYKLRFNKTSSDRSSKANIVYTGSMNDVVYGVVYSIAQSDVANLDAAEGEGVHYKRTKCRVVSASGRRVRCSIYLAIKVTKTDGKPYTWYLKHVTDGAAEHNLPAYYQGNLSRVEAKKQPKPVVVQQPSKRTYGDICPSFQSSRRPVRTNWRAPKSKHKEVNGNCLAYRGQDVQEEPSYMYDTTAYTEEPPAVSHDTLPLDVYHLDADQSTMVDCGLTDEVESDVIDSLGIYHWDRTFSNTAERIDVIHIEGHVAFSYYGHGY